jgi:transposase
MTATCIRSDGVAEIDSLPAERALRGVAIGGRNYISFGSEGGGGRAASMYSLPGTCRLIGLDPEAYPAHVSERIADHPVNRIEDLLPWNVAPLLPSAQREPLR